MSTAIAPQETQQVQKVEKNITDAVLAKIEAFQANGELRIPNNYSPENALKSAWLILQDVKDSQKRPALDVCTKESIANALLKMVVWGLSPLKKQCDFIVYGNSLSCDPEYTGNIALAKRFGGLLWIKANAIFEGDVFEFEVDAETGRRKINSHKQTLEGFGSGKLKGAYAVYELEDGTKDVEIMNISQIQNAWGQGAAKGNSPAHQKFPDQMAVKTVINRACKLLIRGSDDSVLYEKEDSTVDVASSAVQNTIQQNANKKELTFEDAQVIDEKQAEPEGPKSAIQPSQEFTEPMQTPNLNGAASGQKRAPF